MGKKFVSIPQSILNELAKIKNTQAILLTGSRMLGRTSLNSDWDFFLILKDGSSRWRKTWKIGDTWIEVLANNQNQINKEFGIDQKDGRGATTHAFAIGQIVRDNKANVLKKLTSKAKDIWKRGPEELSKEKINFINYNISTYIQDLEDCLHDNNPALLLINQAVDEFVRHYFRIKRIWLVRSKDRSKKFSQQAPGFYSIVLQINRSSDWRRKAKLTIQLGKAIGRRFKLPLDGQVHTPPQQDED